MQEKKARKIEKRERRRGGGAGKMGRDVEAGIGAVRDFEEGNISIDVRFIDLPPPRPYEMAGARVTCHFVKWSHVSRGHLACPPARRLRFVRHVSLRANLIFVASARFVPTLRAAVPSISTRSFRQVVLVIAPTILQTLIVSTNISVAQPCHKSATLAPLSQNASISHRARRRDMRREKYWKVLNIQGAVLSTLPRPVKTEFDTPGLEEGIVGRIGQMLVVYYFVSPIFRPMYIGPYK